MISMEINKNTFLNKKKTSAIFILGSGRSINNLSDSEWGIISKYDSIAFNWFCKHKFEPTFFLLREQANLPSRISKTENKDILLKLVNRYKNTTGIVCDTSNHTKHAYQHGDNLKIPYVILKDIRSRKGRKMKYLTRDIFEFGIVHYNCTLYNVMHFIKFMEYSTVVFVGIDLYDSRYFWLPKNKPRHTIIKKNKKCSDVHPVAGPVIQLISRFHKAFPLVQMYTSNQRSLLCKVIDFRPIHEFGEIVR